MGNQFKNPFAGVKGFADTWYTFMTVCGFYLTAIAFFFLGLGSIIGWQYGAEHGYGMTFRYVQYIVCESYGGLRFLDVVLGIVFIAAAGAAVYVGMQFKARKAIAVKYTNLLYRGFLGLYIAYNFIVLFTFIFDGAKFSDATKVYPIVFPIILIIIFCAVDYCNRRFFKLEGNTFIN